MGRIAQVEPLPRRWDSPCSDLEVSEEDRKWLVEAMQARTLDVAKRMKEITLVMRITEDVLELQGIESADIVGCNCKCHPVSYSRWCIDFLQHLFHPKEMLDELGEHVESIDMANDLHSIGGLVPLLGYLKNSDAGIGAKDADVVTTIVENNPRSRELVMEPLLSNFTSHPDLTVHTEALGVISSLIQNNEAGIAACDLANGDALCSERVKFPWRVLNLVQYLLLRENNSDCSIVVSSAHVREAAVGCHLEFAGDRMSGGSTVLAEEDKLKEVLQQRIEGISG